MKRVDVLQLALAALRRSSELTDAARSWGRADWAQQRSDAIAAIEQELACPPDHAITGDLYAIAANWQSLPAVREAA